MTEKEEEPIDPFNALYELGLMIFCDDAPDFPEVISTWGKEPGKHGVLKGTTMPDLPPHPHHWIAGALIMASSVVGKIFYALESSRLAREELQK